MNDIQDKMEVVVISDQPMNVRFLLNPYKVRCYFTKDGQKIYVHIKDLFETYAPTVWRYACLMIDRADGKVKIMEFPYEIYEQIGQYYEMTGKNPGSGKEGCDFNVKKDSITFVGQTPLTQEEKIIVKESLNGEKKFIQNYYADISISEKEFEKILEIERVEPIEPIEEKELFIPEIPWGLDPDPLFQELTKDTINNLYYLLDSKEYYRNEYNNQEFINLEAYKIRLKMARARQTTMLNVELIEILQKQFKKIIQDCKE